MANRTDTAYEALMGKIAEKAEDANIAQLEALARTFRYVRGGSQPGGTCNCSK